MQARAGQASLAGLLDGHGASVVQEQPSTDQSQVVKEFLRNRDILFGYLLAFVRDYHAAEDLFQELGLAIVSESQKGTHPDSFMAWARSLARHRAIDYFRRQARRQEGQQNMQRLGEALDRAFDENPVSAEESQERLRHLRECLKRLGQRAREIVDLRYRKHLTLREIAAAVSWQEDSVKVALAKARRALAECVGRKLRAQA